MLMAMASACGVEEQATDTGSAVLRSPEKLVVAIGEHGIIVMRIDGGLGTACASAMRACSVWPSPQVGRRL